MKRLHSIWILWALLFLSGAAREPAVGWHYSVKLMDLSRATVLLDLGGLSVRRICVDMSGAGRFVRNVEQVFHGGKTQALLREDECWLLSTASQSVRQVRYDYDLAGAAEAFGSADFVQRMGAAVTFSDEAVLLRPDPLPTGSPSPLIEVEFSLPPGVGITTPWQRLPGPAPRYRLDAAQYDGGSYLTVGNFRPLGTIALPHSQVELFLVGQAKASDQTLRSWVEQAVRLSDGFYGERMPSQVHIVLVAMPGHGGVGSFGTVLRPRRPSLVIFFGGEAERLPLHDDWVATHEVFHVGNPLLRHKIPWLIEGFTTYYQDVLRARAGALSVEEGWSDLWEGIQRHCQGDGPSLRSESERLRQTYHYSRVYWGGACLAMLIDVEIRHKSRGKRSLDDVLVELRTRSLKEPLDEEAVIEVLEQATTTGRVRGYLNQSKALPMVELLKSLGVEPVGTDRVRLHDVAPLVKVRRAMF